MPSVKSPSVNLARAPCPHLETLGLAGMPLLPNSDRPPARTPDRPPPARPRFLTRRHLQGFAAAAAVALVALLFGQPLHEFSYDATYLVRPTVTPDDAVIVTMDLQSHIDLKQRPEGRWSRALHAELIQLLATHQPRAIVLDSVFMEPDIQGPEADAALVEAIRRAGNVAVAATVEGFTRDGISSYQVIPPFAPLRSVARWGPPRYPEQGAVRESIPSTDGRPTLARVVFQMLQPEKGTNAAATPSRFWLNYYGPPGSLPRVSYAAVLRGEVPAETFRNRIVFVGADYKGPFPTAGISATQSGFDNLPTPYTRFTRVKASGVEVVATEVLNLLRNDGLHRWPRWLEWTVFSLFGGGAILLFAMLRPLAAALTCLALALGVASVSLFSVAWTQSWFAWWIPCFVEIPFALAWCLLVRLDHFPSDAGPRELPDSPSIPFIIPGYTLLREIGRGGYGSVWLARDVVGVVRAIKVVRRESVADMAASDREFQGIRRYSPLSLRHPGFTPILHVGREDAQGFFYYVMEAADDQSSGSAIDPERYQPRTLRSEIDRQGFLPVAQTVEIGIALGRALAFLHQHQLVHRDVKPANVLFVGGKARLADLGLVTHLANHPGEVSQVGTPDYLPDEGTGTITAEVYALGKLLAVAVTGKHASQFGELPTRFDERPDANAFRKLNQLLLTACDPDPKQRFPSMEAFVAALERLAA